MLNIGPESIPAQAIARHQPPLDEPHEVLCTHCCASVLMESFVYWATERSAIWFFATCPSCRRSTKWARPDAANFLLQGSRAARASA